MTAAQLSQQARNAAVRSLFLRESGAVNAEMVHRFCSQCRASMRSNIALAETFAEAACSAARYAKDLRALAEALRMRGHVAYLSGNNRRAVLAYGRAVKILERLGLPVDVGRTLSSAIQSLIYLGLYDQALDWAARARRIFEQDVDTLRLARLDSNEANILHRQDRYAEALVLYSRAVSSLRHLGDLESTGIALRNMAVCHAALFDFDRALAAYREAETLYLMKGLPLLAAEIGDNIAQMFHLQGNYIAALESYRAANLEARGNNYHLAVARLDQSDLLLELNLFTEAAELAGNAAVRLAKLGIRYERAKALLNLAVASFRLGHGHRSLQLLRQAKILFERERNPDWMAAVDCYRAAFLLDAGDLEAARGTANLAVQQLESGPFVSKAIAALLLLVKIEMHARRWPEALAFLNRAEARGHLAATLPIRLQLTMMRAGLLRTKGDYDDAWQSYAQAAVILETLRGQFTGDGLRISFLSGNFDCHEQMAALALRGLVSCPLPQVFDLVEQVKSRNLAESMISGGKGEADVESDESAALRRQLSWCYSQLDRAESAAAPNPRPPALLHLIRSIEDHLTAEWSSRTTARRENTAAEDFSLKTLQNGLRPDECLLEYFSSGGDLFALVATSQRLEALHLGTVAQAEQLSRLLRFQMSRGLWASLVAPNDPAWLAATRQHLRGLYDLLIAPLEPWLPHGHWIVVPHGVLHRLPFHALQDGHRYLIDSQTISYAPSAAAHSLCQSRPPTAARRVALFGLADAQAPRILNELEYISALIPHSHLYSGPAATMSQWRQVAPQCRLIHLAAHGLFRQDNPLFSSVRFSDGRLALYDLYKIRLQADLVTLSGCATGVQEPGDGGEVMGITRGLLIAGARAAQVSLWAVNDAGTTAYMSVFYESLKAGQTVAAASRTAMLTTRDASAHPFYWAPFILTGNVRNTVSGIFSHPGPHPIQESPS